MKPRAARAASAPPARADAMDFTDEQLERYARHIVLKEVGGEGQKALLKARVLVIGAGGLGSPLLLYLAAAGVGTIGIVDDDRVALSNLQRQIVYGTDDLAQRKVDAARDRLQALNPDVKIERHILRLDETNARDMVKDYDLVADGSDNFATRLAVNDACVALGKTLVSAAIASYDGQIATFKPHAGKGLPCYRCFVPDLPGEDADRTCADTGILGAVAGVVGSLQALEVIKEITGIGDSLAGKLMIFDGLSMRTRLISLPKDPDCPVCRKVTEQ
nr:HesA/MoeB/ThiF family protein [Pseudokordiimonas caeni]